MKIGPNGFLQTNLFILPYWQQIIGALFAWFINSFLAKVCASIPFLSFCKLVVKSSSERLIEFAQFKRQEN